VKSAEAALAAGVNVMLATADHKANADSHWSSSIGCQLETVSNQKLTLLAGAPAGSKVVLPHFVTSEKVGS
jgi:hypothetical protein